MFVQECNVHKWKNHFYDMKGDVGMSLHEKKGNKKMSTPRHKLIHNSFPTSLCAEKRCFVSYEYIIGKEENKTYSHRITYAVVLKETKM